MFSLQALYVDPEFPPNDSSLGPSLVATGALTWRRPAQFPGVGAATVSAGAAAAAAAFGGYGKPLPSDVRACPFAVDASLACALATLAERPLLVSGALCGRIEETAAALPSACGTIGGGGGCVTSRGIGGEVENFCLENGHHPIRKSSEGGKSLEVRRTGVPSKRTEATAAAVHAFAAAARSGVFCARLCVHGVWKEYVLDDYFPCLSDGGGPCFSRAHGPALWVSMLEKAYSRAMGSYSAAFHGCCLSSGDNPGRGLAAVAARRTGVAAASVIARPAEVLGVFTGAPVLQVKVGGRRREVPGEENAMPPVAAAGGAAGVDEDGDEQSQASEELWGNIVSWPGHRGVEVSWRR